MEQPNRTKHAHTKKHRMMTLATRRFLAGTMLIASTALAKQSTILDENQDAAGTLWKVSSRSEDHAIDEKFSFIKKGGSRITGRLTFPEGTIIVAKAFGEKRNFNPTSPYSKTDRSEIDSTIALPNGGNSA